MGRKLFFGIICVLSLIGAAWGKQDVYREGEVLVVFKNIGPGSTVRNYIRGPVTDKYIKNVISDIIVPQANVMQELDEVKKGLSRISMPDSENVELAIAKFAKSNNVAYAQPNFKYKLCATPAPRTPNDPRFGLHQWALWNTTGGISAPEGWGYTTGNAGIVVAILDTGVQWDHPDLAANMWRDPAFDANDGGEGGWHGWDIAGNLIDAYDPDGDPRPSDDAAISTGVKGHGTHVAGIVGAVGNDSNGITGVCWDTSLMAVKVFADDYEGALSSDIALGIIYAVDKGANVINASLGGGSYDTAFLSAIQYANDNNVVFVAAAGNDGTDNDSLPHYPANYNQELPNVISVMATNNSDNVASYSNYGASTVDIAAPGGDIVSYFEEGILSTVPGDAYDYYQGTSMAAPHVAGAVALMLSLAPNLTAAQVRDIITHPMNVDQVPSLAGKCISEGRLNLYKTLRAANSIKAVADGTQRVINTTTSDEFSTIQAAINAAASGHTLITDNNYWYFEAVDFNGKNITLRSGDISNVSDVNNYASNTFISTLLESGNQSAVTFTNAETTDAVLQGFTISDATTAGVDVNIATPTIRNCIIISNNTGILLNDSDGVVITGTDIIYNGDFSGGGIYCANSLPNISNCNINYNSVTNKGGGIFFTDASSGTITDSNIIGNSANDGAGIYITGGSDPNIYDCTISSNIADNDGGGFYLDSGTAIIHDSNITGNRAIGGDGGGIYQASTAETYNLNFTSNFAKYRGGGMFCQGNVPDVDNCKFTSNTAGNGVYYPFPEGGAIYYYNANSSTNSNSNLIDCEFSQNTAYLDGGAVFVHRGSGLDIQNCLFDRNRSLSYDGGAIFLESSSPTINNCTFASNTNPNGGIGIGGAIFCNVYWKTSSVGSSPVITNSIFSGNRYYAVAEWSANSDASLQYCSFYNNASGDLYDYDTAKAYYRTPEGSQYGFDEFTADTNLNLLNIGGDPNFVTGALGNFYLSQTAAGQTITGDSIAINAGSDTAAALGLDTYQTSTDSSINDSGIVDLGYHYKDPIATPNVDLDFSSASLDGETLDDTEVNLTPDAGTHSYIKYSEVELTSVIENPDYEFESWSGTGSDAISGKDLFAAKPTYRKIVIMDNDRTVVFSVQTALVWVLLIPEDTSEAAEMMFPIGRDNYHVRRGTVVELTAIPVNKSNVVIWSSNVRYPERLSIKNEVIADGGTDGVEIVSVRFYNPNVIPVAADPEDYDNIQRAIDSASNFDTVLLTGGTYRIQGLQVREKNIIIKGSSSDPNDTVLTAMQTANPDGSSGGDNQAFILSNVGVNTRIEGLTIQGFRLAGLSGIDGQAPGEDGDDASNQYGTAILLLNASPTIENCIIRDCSVIGGNGGNGAAGDDTVQEGGDGGEPSAILGGAISILSGSNPVIKKVTFDGCYAIGGNGGNGGNGNTTQYKEGSGGRPGGWYDNQLSRRPSGFGGAMYIASGGSPLIENCTFTNCYSSSGLNGVSGINGWLPNLRDEPFQHFKIDNAGGAVYCEDNSSPIFKNCTFTNNYADPNTTLAGGIINDKPFVSYGGAVYAGELSVPVFENCIFIGNRACAGGSIASSDSDIQINDCFISGSTAYVGGGIQFLRGAPIVSGTILAGNMTVGNLSDDPNIRAVPLGGAVACLSSNAMIQDSMLTYNETTGAGGAIYVASKDVSGVDIYGNQETLLWNCLLTQNSAASGGGAIYAFAHGEPNIVNCTIVGNTVTGAGYTNNYGGGIYCSDKGYAKLLNTIVWGNAAASGIGNQIAATGDVSHYSAVKVAYSNIQGGAGYPGIFIDNDSMLEWDTRSNLNGVTTNPLFVAAEGFYLSQDPCQTTTSQCVDTGSDTVVAAGLYRHSTNTDGTIDTGIVDIGYHYVLNTALIGDLDYDGDVDSTDIAWLSDKWLQNDCAYPDWCQGRDFNQDGVVNYLDYNLITKEYGESDPNLNNEPNDITAPMPNPMKWATVPEANSTTTIYMVAAIAYDNQGGDVWYEFARVNTTTNEPTGQHDAPGVTSGWREGTEGRSWTDTGLLKNMAYSYRVRAKDTKGNKTDWSTQIQSATTASDGTIESDHTAPNWPMLNDAAIVWSIIPYAYDAEAPGEIRMKANAAQDTSLPIQYRFTIKKNGATVTAYSSSWQTSRDWVATNVFGGNYSVYVEAKDAAGNITALPTPVVVNIAGDGDAPATVDNPLTATAFISTNRVYLTLNSQVPVDATTPIYYRFSSNDSTGNSVLAYHKLNGWLTTNTLTFEYGTAISRSFWFVEFMDGAGNTTGIKYPVDGAEVPFLKI